MKVTIYIAVIFKQLSLQNETQMLFISSVTISVTISYDILPLRKGELENMH